MKKQHLFLMAFIFVFLSINFISAADRITIQTINTQTGGTYSGLGGQRITFNVTQTISALEINTTINGIANNLSDAWICTGMSGTACNGTIIAHAIIKTPFANFTTPWTGNAGGSGYLLLFNTSNGSIQRGQGTLQAPPFSFKYGTVNSTINMETQNEEVGAWGVDLINIYNFTAATPGTPTVNLVLPLNGSQQIGTYIGFNTTIIPYNAGQNVTNETLQIWYSNGTLFMLNQSLLSGNSQYNVTWNITGFSYGQDYIWNVKAYANDSTNGTATNNYTFTASAFTEDSVSYNASALETSGQDFLLQITGSSNISSISGVIWYNGSNYTLTVHDGTSNGKYNLSNTIDIPLSTIDSATKSFYWEINFTFTNGNSIKQNSSTKNQIVNRTYIEFCNATYDTTMVNFTTKSAENPFPSVNATFKSSWNWYVSTGTGSIVRNASHENVTEQTNIFAFCTKNYTQSYQTNTNIEIDATGYAKNFHYLTNATLTNTSNNISLFLLNDSKATLTVLRVLDKAQNPVENVSVQVQLYDIGTDSFYTVTMAKTTFNGEDTVYLNWYDTLYKFIFIQNNTVVKTTVPYKIAETPQVFEISDAVTYSFDKFRDFEYNLYYNNLTQNFVLTFTKPSGLVDEGCLRVIKRTAQNDTLISETCETSSSATLYSNIAAYGNGTYIATFYATGSWYLVDWIDESIGTSFSESIFDLLGSEDATAYAFLFSGVVVSLFLISPVLAIIGAILGILGAGALGFTLMDYTIYMGMVILGGIIIWILKR